MVFGSAEALKRAVVAGLGLSCLSEWAVKDQLVSGSLITLHTPLPKLSRRFYIVHHKKKYLSARLKQFIDHCQTAKPIPV
jgi:DNA-binding transcriptional LysR family regulator